MAGRIVALLPPHERYVEAFGGALSVLLAKPPSRHEVANDVDGDLVTFWRVLRDDAEGLARVCLLTPHSRRERVLALDRPEDLDDLERSRRVWTCLTQGRASTLAVTG